MADLLQTGMSWLAGKMKKYASQSLTYSRGSASVPIQGSPGKTLLSLDDGYGARVEWTDQDFLIVAADMILSGSPTLPQRGDQISWTIGSTTYVFEVMAPGSEPVWRWSDEHRTVLRIHVKLVATE